MDIPKTQIKIFIVALVVLAVLAVLAYFNSGIFYGKMANIKGYMTRCVDGVRYIEFSRGVSVKYNKDTKQIENCNE